MLEALISLRRNEGDGTIGGCETACEKAGDILLVKKQPCEWGGDEKTMFLITYLDDPALEASMNNEKLGLPYAVRNDDGGHVLPEVF